MEEFLSTKDLRIFFIIVLIFCGCFRFFYLMIKGQEDTFNPRTFLPIFYTFYALGPLTESKFPIEIEVRYLFLQLIGIIGLHLGLYLFTPKKSMPPSYNFLLNISEKQKKIFISTAFCLLGLSLPSLISIFEAFGGLSGFLRWGGYGGEFYLRSQEGVVLGSGFIWWKIASIMIIVYGIVFKKRWALMIGILLLLPVLILSLIVGRRKPIAYPVIFGILFLHYAWKRLPVRLVLVSLFLGIFAMEIWSLLRYYLVREGIIGMITGAPQVIEAIYKNPRLIVPWNSNEFKTPASCLFELLSEKEKTLLLGESYLRAFLSIFPIIGRIFYDYFFDLQRWLLKVHHPEIFLKNENLGFSPVIEAYGNFREIGVFIILFIYGFIIAIIYRAALKYPSLFTLLLYVGAFPIFIIDAFRVPSDTLTYSLSREMLFPAIIYFLITLLVNSLSLLSNKYGKRKN